jgi:nicotinamidase-related amidase
VTIIFVTRAAEHCAQVRILKADMRHANTLDPRKAALVIVDMQEGFRSAIDGFEKIAANIATITKAMTLLNLPVLVTEQNPAKLGATIAELRDLLPVQIKAVDKTAFSCCGSTAFLDRLSATKASQILLAGIEAHVCMNQTAHDLLARGYQVHLLTDCTSSRTSQNREVGIAKTVQSGAIPCSVEMALFELMVDAKHEQFRAIQKLIK